MKVWIAAVVASLASVSSCFAADERTSAVVEVYWDISLDATGHVAEVATKDLRVPKLHAYLEKAIRDWQFSPGKVNGQPAVTQTHLYTKFEIRTVGDGFEVRVLGADTGADYRKTAPPHYPDSALRAGKQGGVMLDVRYDKDGLVTSVEPGEKHSRTDDRLVQAAMSSVKEWVFAPEVVGGHPIAGEAEVPICFHLGARELSSCSFRNPATGESLAGGEAVALNPAAKLETDVIGRTL